MCSTGASRGTPDFGQMLSRSRLVQRIAQSGDKPCVLLGPSGCGKSVAAAQYASCSARRTIWVDAGREFLSGTQLACATLKALGQARQYPNGVRLSDTPVLADVVDAITRFTRATDGTGERLLIVVDDLGAPESPRDVSDHWTLARGLWRVGSRLLVTCRGVSGWPSDYLKECALVGPDELALTSDEAEEYMGNAGLNSLLGVCDEIRAASGGHPAFFAVLASQALTHGLAARAGRTPSLEAWLGDAIEGQLGSEEKWALVSAALLRSGDDRDLASLGIESPTAALDRIESAIPLAGCSRTKHGGRTFRIHQLLDDHLADASDDRDLFVDPCLMAKAVALLSKRGDYSRAAELLGRQAAPEQTIAWLVEYGHRALQDGHTVSLSRLIDCTPVAALMARPSLLLTWAEVCGETGHVEDAIAKCRAARTLAEHENDREVVYGAIALCARYTSHANLIEEAEALLTEILAAPQGLVPDVAVAEALLCRAHNAFWRGEYELAQDMFREAIVVSGMSSKARHVVRSAKRSLSMIPAIAWGDHVSSSRLLAPTIVDGQREYLTERVMAKGNVALCLCELGRLSRAEQLLESVLAESRPAGIDEYSGGYLAVLGCVKTGQGESELGLNLMKEGIALSLRGGDEPGADASRLYMCIALRAVGELTESLIVAERAFERLALADMYGFRRVAILEVAASLLSLGDAAAAAAWVGMVVSEGFAGNQYHAIRAAFILSEIDRREGRQDDAISRIRDHSVYLLSENANWQAALYCRAFPGLLGVMAVAVTPRMLPAHLLRMIPAEDAERILRETESFLEAAVWRELGDRLIGTSEMEKFLSRGGVPQCHVRLFGGLEVSVGGRVVHDRDWKKRKARMLFVMLVTKRGRDVPREQVIDYLWPGMDEERARNNLYVAWSMMKSVLGGPSGKGTPCPYVESVGGVCRTVSDTVRSDVDEFEEALTAARAAESGAGSEDPLASYERIANLYRGDLLPGDVYDDWFAGARDHYRSEFVDAMLRASQLLIDAGDPGNALIYLRRAIQTDSLREDLYQRALRCQIAAGQRSSAIDTYLQCRDKLSEELGLDPSTETRALYDDILSMEDRPLPIPIDPLSTWSGAHGI